MNLKFDHSFISIGPFKDGHPKRPFSKWDLYKNGQKHADEQTFFPRFSFWDLVVSQNNLKYGPFDKSL